MNQNSAKSVSIFLTLDKLLIKSYFNKHDPAPIYKRQLSLHFEDYILQSLKPAKRYTPVLYKLNCRSEEDKKFAEPLMYSIRRHFSAQKKEREKEFAKFKRRNYMMLVVSIIIVIVFQGFIPMILESIPGIHAGLLNSFDIFAWVLLWHPIDELVFSWNKHLKQINQLNKLATAEAIIIENENSVVADNAFRVVA